MASSEDVDELAAALAMPLTVVRLTVSIGEIERRLGMAVTAGRADVLRVAKEWITTGRGEGVGDHVVENEHLEREVALQVLSFLRWDEVRERR